MNGMEIWQAKVAARIHDPAEKAIVLLRDPAGHEGGTVRVLREELFGEEAWKRFKPIVEKADHWAAAADRPQFPQEEGNRYAAWTQVRFAERPEIKHPLTGESFDLRTLKDLEVEHVKAVSTDHFRTLIRKSNGEVDWRRTLLAFWRFGPELDAKGLRLLWPLLPADTRVPDHTIWAHLDLASALAGAMATDADGTPALLTMSFGPVQAFIAQARSTSDLWAGSHLLSRIAWEGLKVVCEELGPDAVIFPQLHGLPLVDAWVEQELGGWPEGFEEPFWKHAGTDANPLFAAALPNRFVAIVPASRAKEIAKKVQKAAREWVMEQGERALRMLQEKSGVEDAGYAAEQVQRQLEHFPECHWCAVPWSLVSGDGANMDVSRLRSALASFYPEGTKVGFLDSDAWKLLSQEITVEGHRFYAPNGGVLYPAFYDLLERAQAAVKALRSFAPQQQEGYRCALCGEREWLALDKEDLFRPPEKRKAVLWKNLPDSWARKKGEQLCALCTLKRLWPTMFAEDVQKMTGREERPRRFVVSTHTMALARDLARKAGDEVPESFQELAEEKDAERVALPAKLARTLKEKTATFARIPGLLDAVREDERTRRKVERMLKEWFGHAPEAYYGLLYFDGDKMGAWLRGNEPFTQLHFRDAWHAQVHDAVRNKAKDFPDLEKYLNETRPVSPARHAAISAALNSFALHLARFAVEEVHHGKLIYAGGDDVMAMVPVAELLSCMRLLRVLYSGHAPQEIRQRLPKEIDEVAHGFVHCRGRLLRVMGERATASVGAVVAHHMAPLGRVLKELRAAEGRAKKAGGRDAFTIRVIKRGGGTVETTARWFQKSSLDKPGTAALPEHPSLLLEELACALGGAHLSRRAAYHVLSQLRELPTRAHLGDGFADMLEAVLVRQFRQQFQRDGSKSREENERGREKILALASRLARLACAAAPGREAEWLKGFMAVAEFLGREGRMGDSA